MAAIIPWAEKTSYNQILGDGRQGIVGVGFAFQKILDIFDGESYEPFRLLKLGVLYPLPRNIIADFLQNCVEVLVVEENEPFIEIQIKALAHELDFPVKIFGKQSGHLPSEGEVFRWHICDAISQWIPEFVPNRSFVKEDEEKERPKKKSFCGNCRYDEVLDKLEEAANALGQKPVLVGDPGCLVTVADRLDAKYAMGSAVGVADGVSKAGCNERAVAVFGDSAFFHTALPAICNVVHNRSDILMVVLDNKATTTSGFQPNPGVGKNALGQEAPALDIERITRACGVKSIYSSNLDDTDPPLTEVFRSALNHPDLALIIVRIDKST
jgi:indolepyruvate ferredoxin oxidoreductase alpha subunit